MNLRTSENRASPHDIETVSVEGLRLLNNLQDLLERLLQLAHQSDSANKQFSTLTDQAGSLVNKITQVGILDVPEYRSRREQVRKQYEDLCLIVAAQKANTSREINQIQRGRKILKTYRRNI